MDLKQALEALASEQAKTAELTSKVAEFSSTVTALTVERDELNGKVAKLTTDLDKLNGEKQAAEFSAFVDNLIAERRLLPDRKNEIVGHLGILAKASSVPEFSAATDNSPLEIFKRQLKAMPQSVPGGEHSADNRGAPEFSGNKAQAIADAANIYQAEQARNGVTVSASEAVAHIKSKMNQ